MSPVSPRGRATLAVALVGLLTLASCADAPWAGNTAQRDAERAQTRDTMARILNALRVALPLGLSEQRFNDPTNQPAIAEALNTLATHAQILESHGSDRDAGFRYLSRSLAEDSKALSVRYQAGMHREARFLLGQITENCVACHSHLPSPQASSLGRLLMEDVDVDSLRPAERARLQVATRQFDAALLTYESLLRASATPPTRLDLEGLLTDYLVLAIRVENDLPRARHVLEAFAARGDLPRYLERNVRAWIRDLKELERAPSVGPPVARAQALLDESRRRSGFPADRTVLVRDLVASGLLHAYVSGQRTASPELAEGYYLLGVAEARTRRSFWLSEGEFYLETAIRMAPRADFAELAYARLEEETLAGYSGSSGLHLPADVLAKLEELRALVEGR